MEPPLCIYHYPCVDGFTAAWAVRELCDMDAEFFPGTHGEPPPDVTGRHVIMVDFSYKRPALEEMLKKAKSMLILDHHASAEKELAFMPTSVNPYALDYKEDIVEKGATLAIFDKSKSGAGLAWDFFVSEYSHLDRPQVLNHVEDYDLFKFKYDDTEAIQMVLFSHHYAFGTWDELMWENPDTLAMEGYAILRKHNKDIEEFLRDNVRYMKISQNVVPVVNMPYFYASRAAGRLAQREDAPFAAVYWDTDHNRVFSLRSASNGVDVSKVAVKYGGGGHVHAAGFQAPIGWDGEY